jgi:hypothetical protein
MKRTLIQLVESHIHSNDKLKNHVQKFEAMVSDNKLSPLDAAKQIFELLNLV